MGLDVDGLMDHLEAETRSASTVQRWTGRFAAEVLRWREGEAMDIDRAFMAYDGLLNSRHQFDEAALTIAGTLAGAHLRTIGIAAPRMLAGLE